MSGRPRRGWRAATAVLLATALTIAVGGSAVAQDGDLCGALTLDEVAVAVPGTFEEPAGFPGTCQWHGSTDGGADAEIFLYTAPGTALDAGVEGGTETTIAGQRAFSAPDPSMTTPTHVVIVDVGDEAIILSVATADEAIDLPAAATQLAEAAVPRFLSGEVGGPTESAAAETATTHGDPCELFSAEDLSGAIGATPTAAPGFESCRWDSADGSSSIVVSFAEGGLTTIRTLYPEGTDITVGGQPAYQSDQSFTGLTASEVDVDLGPDTMSVLVTSTDEAIDAAALALQLAEQAFQNGITVLPEPEGVVLACQLASPEEVAAAAGLAFDLTVQDYETQCTYEGGQGNKHILITVATQDPATFPLVVDSLGGTELDGPGDRTWWIPAYGSLAASQGDLVVQVTVYPDKKLPEAKLKRIATAVMEVLLAP